jgi:hypothetical protein
VVIRRLLKPLWFKSFIILSAFVSLPIFRCVARFIGYQSIELFLKDDPIGIRKLFLKPADIAGQ